MSLTALSVDCCGAKLVTLLEQNGQSPPPCTPEQTLNLGPPPLDLTPWKEDAGDSAISWAHTVKCSGHRQMVRGDVAVEPRPEVWLARLPRTGLRPVNRCQPRSKPSVVVSD